MSAEGRILDANANRAREALRVLEDTARFALDDGDLAGELKAARHALRQTLERLPAGWLEANRDTAADVGRTVSEPSEWRRAGLADVAAAAGKRLTEALRVMEETAKVLNPACAREIETLRYRVYELDSAVHRKLGSTRRRQWRICLLLTEACCVRPWREVLEGALAGGADAVQVREPTLADGALLRRVSEVVEIARSAGASVIVNDRADVALAGGADGVHLGQDDLPVAAIRRLAGRTLLVGVSARDLEQAQRAVEAGADYLGLGAMFETTTKNTPPAVGPAWIRAFRERYPDMPHLAIGGIRPDNIGALVEAGARGVAICGAVCAAERPDEIVRTLRETLDGAPVG